MFSYRAQGLLAIGLGCFAIGSLTACEDPELKTALRPEGDPEVLTVMVGSGFDIFTEVPTFCKENDDKVPINNPGGVQICPRPNTDDPPVGEVTDAVPEDWQVRIVFDELLDPDVEDLIDAETGGPCTDESSSCAGTLARTQPVDLVCNDEPVPYDGWYDPTGNAVTIPPGPSLLVYPTGAVATSAGCSITLRDSVVDKDGNPVPDAQQGPYQFGVAALDIVETDPPASDPPAEIAPDAALAVIFNASIDETSLEAGEITLTDAASAAVAFTPAADGAALVLTPDAALAAGDYTLTITAGATFADVAGGTMTVADDIVVTFTVVPAA